MSLSRFIYDKVIMIDDAGWGDLILGVVVGALKLPDRRYMERRIPVTAFQPPNFERKAYLDEAVRIAEEIVAVMRPDEKTYFKVCSGYILSRIRSYLKQRGFHVETTRIEGELQERVEKGYIDWCIEVGVPPERLREKRRFYPLLEWVAEKVELRERLVKTGWRSWRERWREKAYQIHLERVTKAKERYYIHKP
ncbi:MAG: hypothetical protein AYL33_001900 [Candidatus Bathyarchaeota archaeon B63]|nr:MAG: hypothetical protein AYL33_001900 [Candidatus Bathyarchaeota archaeon B63]